MVASSLDQPTPPLSMHPHSGRASGLVMDALLINPAREAALPVTVVALCSATVLVIRHQCLNRACPPELAVARGNKATVRVEVPASLSINPNPILLHWRIE
ncbi:unnamed protein product [Fraxinus pennsylvanica]|uniref:Uncharacterized protein n=1 Tax=Fraxinus pennsylvanica TaxID=56036 RepID=A0AAD1ZA92_9LAMI|nr:unnamed protein product [Fraxinus pennsylvanica]